MNRSVTRFLGRMVLCAGIAVGVARVSEAIAVSPQAATSAVLPGATLCFERAPGSPGETPRFVARGGDFYFAIAPLRAEITLEKTTPVSPRRSFGQRAAVARGEVSRRSMSIEFLGANRRARLCGQALLPGKINYLVGNDVSKWRSGVATYGKVCVQSLYEGVNAVYYGNHDQLEYDLELAAGIDPRIIKIRFNGADAVNIDEQGRLALKLEGEVVYQHQPIVYQTVAGARKPLQGKYRLLGRDTVGFDIGSYDRSLPLIVDPILTYSSYFGGNRRDLALAVKLDSAGSIYLAGETLSTIFSAVPPNTPGFRKRFSGGTITGDAFVAKFDNTGSNLVYFTYLGGRLDEAALDLAIDAQGRAFITGFTDSPNFPTTANALSRRIHGTPNPNTSIYPNDAFVAELSADGASLVYSTFLGGAGYESAGGIALDPGGSVYVTGYTTSTNFPVAGGTNLIQKKIGGRFDAFVTRFVPGESSLIYSTYLGGISQDEGEGIAVDNHGFAYVTGYTSSRNFPITNAFSQYLNGRTNKTVYYDAFVSKVAPEGRLIYSTLLGGFYNDYGYRIALDQQGNAYVTGVSGSLDFPNVHSIQGLTPGWLIALHSNDDPFLTKIGVGTNGAAEIKYSILFGGSGGDVGWGVAVDQAGDAFVVGTSYSGDFPTFHSNSLLRGTNTGRADVFITAINREASAVLYSAYLGGANFDIGYGIAVDSQSTAYVVGRTLSVSFPVVPPGQAFQTARQGKGDGFLVKVLMEPVLFENLVGGNLQLSWPPSALTYVLESTPSLSPPTWTPVTAAPALVNGYSTVVVPVSGTSGFFRLRQAGS